MMVTLAEESPPKCKVLILGAGATGLAESYQLKKLGITDYVILEVSDTIGGRMKSVNLGKHTVQTGNFTFDNLIIKSIDVFIIDVNYLKIRAKLDGGHSWIVVMKTCKGIKT